MNIKTRFAPSPTGNLHIGGVRTAILSWLIAQKNKGEFLLRIEDTDKERSKPEFVQDIMNGLDWLDIKINNQKNIPYQTQRFERYQKVAEQLVKNGLAYYCYCTNEELQQKREEYKEKTGHDGWKYDRKWRDSKEIPPIGVKPSIRLKVPLDGSVVWKDLIKGGIEIQNQQLDDFIIIRSDGIPTYNFCVVVDDVDMEISHVIRGEDHINNTPKQIHIYKALQKEIPIFGHVPLILNMDGSKQSKRVNQNEKMDDDEILPMTSLNYYQRKGFLPEAMVNYLLLISCNNIEKEIFTKEEFVNMFDLNKLGNTPIKFDLNKLIWINQQYLKNITDEKFLAIAKEKNDWMKDKNVLILKNAILQRSKTLLDIDRFFKPLENPNFENIENNLMVKEFFQELIHINLWTPENILQKAQEFCENKNIKMKELMNPIRLNILNGNVLPIQEVLVFYGKEELEKKIQIKSMNKLKK